MMDPFALLKTVWRFKWIAAPGVVLLVLGALYVLLLAPRTYEATAIYVVANPNQPTDREIEQDSRLARLNSDNPYLRADDRSLIVQALVSKMSSASIQQEADEAGLDTDYTVAQSPTSTMTVVVTSVGGTPDQAISARGWLVDKMASELQTMQKVNGADDRFLFTALPIDLAPKATEKVSSRLRSLILVVAAGGILIVASVSVAVALTRRREEGDPAADARPKTETRSGTDDHQQKTSTSGAAGSDRTTPSTAHWGD